MSPSQTDGLPSTFIISFLVMLTKLETFPLSACKFRSFSTPSTHTLSLMSLSQLCRLNIELHIGCNIQIGLFCTKISLNHLSQPSYNSSTHELCSCIMLFVHRSVHRDLKGSVDEEKKLPRVLLRKRDVICDNE